MAPERTAWTRGTRWAATGSYSGTRSPGTWLTWRPSTPLRGTETMRTLIVGGARPAVFPGNQPTATQRRWRQAGQGCQDRAVGPVRLGPGHLARGTITSCRGTMVSTSFRRLTAAQQLPASQHVVLDLLLARPGPPQDPAGGSITIAFCRRSLRRPGSQVHAAGSALPGRVHPGHGDHLARMEPRQDAG